jgi:hypothetical protein
MVAGAAIGFLWVISAVSAAPGNSLVLSFSPNPVLDSSPVDLHISGQTTSTQPLVLFYWQQAGGACPADPNSASPSTFDQFDAASPSTGAFSDDNTSEFPAGTVLVCAYLVDTANPDPITGNPPVLASTAATLHVSPAHPHLAMHVPARRDVGQPLTVSLSWTGLPVTAQVGERLDLWALHGAASCPATPDQEPSGAQNLLDPGSFGSSWSGSFNSYGRYLFCAWLERLGPAFGSIIAGPVAAETVVERPSGGSWFRGVSSQHLRIRFKVIPGEAYDVSFGVRLRCKGRSARALTKTDPLYAIWLDSLGRFVVDFTGGPARGVIRGRIGAHSARGSLSETYRQASGAVCTTGPVSWSATG